MSDQPEVADHDQEWHSQSGRMVTEAAAMTAWRLVEHIPAPLAVAQPGGRLIAANRAFASLVGTSQQRLLRGMQIGDALPGVVVEGLAPGAHQTVTLTLANSGGRVPMEVLLARAGDEIHIMVHDVRELLERERRHRSGEKMDAMSQLAAGVAHEMNNQLAGILGYAGLLRRKTDDPNALHYADRISAVGHQGTTTTNRLMAFAGCAHAERQAVFVHDLVREVVLQIQPTTAADVTFQQELRAHNQAVKANREALREALREVLVNAVTAVGDHGIITIRTSDLKRADAGLALVVTDDGCGMEPETQARAIEPYFTTRSRGAGTGMGLAAAWGIVREIGGELAVTSTPGQGTTVTMRLITDTTTSHSARQRAAQHLPTPSEPAKRTGRILLVDDELAVREAYAEALGEVGYTISSCAAFDEAWEVFRPQPAAVDLVVIDRCLGDRSGLELLTAMRAENPDLPCILVSGYAADPLVQEDRQTVSIQKPFPLHRLERLIERLLSQVSS